MSAAEEVTLVTTKQVRDWARTEGLVSTNRGIVAVDVIAAYEKAHPGHLYSRYAHGPGGYDKGCRCDECKSAHGVDPNYCATCTRRRGSVTVAKDEVRRLARAMSQGARNQARLAPALTAAKAQVARAKDHLEAHLREHEAGAA